MTGSDAGVDHGILGVVPSYARIVPNARSQEVVALILIVCKQFSPIRRPLFVNVAAAALPWNGGGKQHHVCGVAQSLHKVSRRRGRQVFGYFERERQVEPAIKL